MLNKQGLFSRTPTPQGSSSVNPATSASLNSKPEVSPTHHVATASSVATPVKTEAAGTQLDTQTGSRLIVGPDVKLKGAEIQDCDILVVEGRVEATMDSRVIQIAENGAFSGKVGIDVAEVRGHFEGELTARSQLIIHSTGRVSGKIRYGKILIEEGGELSGDIASISAEDNAGKVKRIQSAAS
ncbi:protein CcmA, bactofilin family [Methylobacillus rhizosphaerae]|uniref:Protein CcmA, bactofilin family n=1 Tax=Methylobacillus rhizosphaerae TaxID=551994 RepID=A0A238Z177_9PROT|nr:polymer-forming cytoskeletal protein [Methylobacillus rhizosphaerae]SNR77022.1 protein CcmA, bactofilin family [Methylobacillus rhizosphaerae]